MIIKEFLFFLNLIKYSSNEKFTFFTDSIICF